MAKSTGRGRPSLFRGAMAKAVAGLLKANGLKGGKELLAQMGSVSLPTLQKLAKEHGVEFERGRPASGKTAKAAKSTKPVKGKRGRPLGSKNKVKTETPVVATGKRRGRPLGSKNKPKTETPVATTVVETPVVAVVETPVVNEPVVETPVVETPVVETPVAETIPAPAPATSTEVAA